MDHTVDSTLKFLSNNCQSVLIEGYGSVRKPSKTAAGIYEVQTLLRYLSAIFDRHILRQDDDSTIHMMQRQRQSVSSTSSRQSSGIPASDTGKVTSSFAFAFVWAFGGHLHERYDKWIIFVFIKHKSSAVKIPKQTSSLHGLITPKAAKFVYSKNVLLFYVPNFHPWTVSVITYLSCSTL